MAAVLNAPPGMPATLATVLAAPAAPAAPAITCRDIGVRFFTERRDVTAIGSLDLDVAQGEFLTLLGPSGCGKSTFLRVVADLLQPSRGRIEVLSSTPQAARKNRDIGFVFQDAALLPWRTALQNVELPLQVGGGASRKGRRSPRELLELVGLKDRLGAFPHEMSGGQRQRVSIARALASDPKILLMDEPFGALDEITRDRLNEEILRVWRETGVTILFVTHSIHEAAFLGQRVLMLAANPGRVREIVPVELPADRTLEMRETPEFVRLTSHLRRVLETC
ncbi:ABC transporter ATP-binding protein [Variovorax sp. KBW07]|uniref:ABC transporter ATP-binding protein n=1 Tax=Variovorax sp. KBW07 TaxID=2153358 RepID=UPI0021A9E20D|nr:ABC transporter ATP-binding protein [Variovorax sp. KBW07]